MNKILIICFISMLIIAGCGTSQGGTGNSLKSQLHEKHLLMASEKDTSQFFSDVDTVVTVNNDETTTNLKNNTPEDDLPNQSKEHENKKTPANSDRTETKDVDEKKTTDNRDVSQDKEESKQSKDESNVQEDTFLKILNEYNNMFERIKPDVDYSDLSEEGYKFRTIETKEQLYNKFTDILTFEISSQTWAGFVNEGNGALYIIPTELYPIFNQEDPYVIEKVNDSAYKLFSRHKCGLHGEVDMKFTFTKLDGHWKISSQFNDYNYSQEINS